MPDEGMKLYLIEHDHTDEACPGHTEEGMTFVADLISGKEHTQRSQVAIVASYVPVGTHRVLVVLAANNFRSAQQYAEPFKKLGPTTISEVARGETVVHEGLKEYKR